MPENLDNPNPVIYDVVSRQRKTLRTDLELSEASEDRDLIDNEEVYDLIREIMDPEHPLTLEQLKVVTLELITVSDKGNHVDVVFTPTVKGCTLATLIGLAIRVKLLRSLPSRFKVDIRVAPGSHQSEDAVNKQLNDKERVAAALENPNLLDVVNKCIANND